MNIACPNCSQGLTIPDTTQIGSAITCGACRHRWAFSPAHPVAVAEAKHPLPTFSAIVCIVWAVVFLLSISIVFNYPGAAWGIPFFFAFVVDRCYHAVKP